MKLRRGRLPAQLLEFFGNNPDEELTPTQVAVKFSASRNAVSMALATLVKAGFIENVRVVRIRAKGRAGNPTEGLPAAAPGPESSLPLGSEPCAPA